jgi:competence protein ComEC
MPGRVMWAWCLTAICAGAILFHVARKHTVRLIPLAFFCLLGYLSIQPWVSPAFPANHILHYSDAQRWEIEGQILNQPRQIGSRTKFVMRVESLKNQQQYLVASGKLRVTAVGNIPHLTIGDEILIKSRIRSITNFSNPGGFNYQAYMAYKGIWASAFVNQDKIAVVAKDPQKSFKTIINDIRSRFANLADQSRHSQTSAVLKALIIGDRSDLSADARKKFNRAGVGHLLAISGLHIGIVATVAFIFFRWVLVHIKWLLRRAWTRKGAALLSLIPVILYGIIAGLSPSTLRAVIMVSIFLMTFVFERDQNPMNTLALAACVILIADPPSLYSISFQLSFTAVFAILFGFSHMPESLTVSYGSGSNNWRVHILKRLLSFFLVSVFAVWGSMPLVMFYFNQISCVGLLANFAVVPLVGFISIPLGLLGLFLIPLSVTGASWCIQAGTEILWFALEVVSWLADFQFAAVKVISPSLLEIGCYYALCWSLLTLWVERKKALPARENQRVPMDSSGGEFTTSGFWAKKNTSGGLGARHKALYAFFCSRRNLALTILGAVVVTLSADTCYWLYQRFWNSDLRVTIIDVGHGNAALLELPGGYTMMIDGGGFADNAVFDMGAQVIAPLLWRKKIKTVDTLILSHPNSDHLNGLIYIAEHFNVSQIWTNNESRSTTGYLQLMNVIKSKNILLPRYNELARIHRINGIDLHILYPPQDFLKRKKNDRWRNLNNNSLTVKVMYGSISFLFPGDIMAAAERELIGSCKNQLTSTVLIAPHHGSRSSSTEMFLDKVAPEIVIISSSSKFRPGMPHSTVLQRYRRRACQLLRTDLNGAVRFITDGDRLSVKPFIVSPIP